jgi:hypothetical protein
MIRTMNKIYLFAGMAVLMVSSCSTEEQSAGGYVAGSKVILNASLPNSGTRVNEVASDTYGLITTWSDDDSLDVLANTNAIVYMTKGDGNTFTAAPATPAIGTGFNAGKTIYGVNNKSNDKITTSLNGSQLNATVDFTGQNGTVDNLKKYDLMYGKGDPTSNVTFNHKICVLRLDINSAQLKADGITSITGLKLKYVVTSGTPLFASQEVYNFGTTCDSTVTDADSLYLNNTKITVADGKATVYIAVPHRQSLYGNLYIKLKGSNGTVSSIYDLTNAISLSNGRMLMSTVHPQTITDLTRNTTLNIGNYLFSDGTWGSLADSFGFTPIAIIFSKTTSTTDQGHGWTHGYAMALKNASTSCPWNDVSSVTTGTYSTTTAAMMADKDGYTHTSYINSSACPAAYAAATSYNTTVAAPNSTSGWYLPSIGQWFDICTNLGKVKITDDCFVDQTTWFYWSGAASGCANNINVYLTPLATGTYDRFTQDASHSYVYWCSSESDGAEAHYTSFSSNDYLTMGCTNKDDTWCARGVIAF